MLPKYLFTILGIYMVYLPAVKRVLTPPRIRNEPLDETSSQTTMSLFKNHSSGFTEAIYTISRCLYYCLKGLFTLTNPLKIANLKRNTPRELFVVNTLRSIHDAMVNYESEKKADNSDRKHDSDYSSHPKDKINLFINSDKLEITYDKYKVLFGNNLLIEVNGKDEFNRLKNNIDIMLFNYDFLYHANQIMEYATKIQVTIFSADEFLDNIINSLRENKFPEYNQSIEYMKNKFMDNKYELDINTITDKLKRLEPDLVVGIDGSWSNFINMSIAIGIYIQEQNKGNHSLLVTSDKAAE